MRISSATINDQAVAAILAQQSRLARTQNELATGKRVQTPADDPAAATAIARLQRSLVADVQYAGNAAMATNRLSFSEQALTAAGNALQRLQELAVQANSSTLDQPTRRSLAAEMRSRADEIIDIANRQDASGDHLFSGLRAGLQPFSRDATAAVTYQGDAASRAVKISATQRVVDGHSGAEVFMNLRGGNGSFVTAAAATNNGAARIDIGSVVALAAWSAAAGSYSINFVTPGSYEVRDSANTLVVAASYVQGTAINFNGAQVTISGAAAAGDQFTLDVATRQPIFATIDRLIAAVEGPAGTPSERALFVTEMSRAINDLGRSNDHLLGIRAEIGARLSTIDNGDQARADARFELERTLSELQDVDYAEAVSRMNLQLAGLQAAQQSYTRISQLSLFNYL